MKKASSRRALAWGRDKLAVLMDELFEQHYGSGGRRLRRGVREKDTSSGLNVLQELGRKQFKDVTQFQSVLSQIKPISNTILVWQQAQAA